MPTLATIKAVAKMGYPILGSIQESGPPKGWINAVRALREGALIGWNNGVMNGAPAKDAGPLRKMSYWSSATEAERWAAFSF